MIVRTVLGDIDPAELGPCDAHEHLFLDTPAQPGEEFLDVDKAIEEAATLVVAGGRSLVDWTPIGLGRDLDGLEAVSRATGLHVVARDRPAPGRALHRGRSPSLRGRRRTRRPVRRGAARALRDRQGRRELSPPDAVRADRVRGGGGSARRDRRARVRAHPARDDGARDRRATRWARGSAKVGRSSPTSTATPTRVSTQRRPRPARRSSSTAPAERSTGPTRRFSG